MSRRRAVLAVNQIFTFTGSIQAARDGDVFSLGVVRWPPRCSMRHSAAGMCGRGIDHRQRDLRHPERLPFARAGEDHVFHPRAAEALGALLAQNPTDRITEVGFAAAVRSHNGGDAGAVKPHLRAVIEGFESMNIDAFKLEQNLALHLV